MEKLEQTPMSDKVKERIEADADEYVKQYLPYVDTTGHWLGFQDGATAERPKARNEAIDEVIDLLREYVDMGYIERKWSTLESELEKLKHKQP